MAKVATIILGFLSVIGQLNAKKEMKHEDSSFDELLDYIKEVEIDFSDFKHLQNTEFLFMFFYKQSHIEADYILQVVQNTVERLEKVFPKMQFEIIDSDEELELAHHYSVLMHCKIFLKFSDTTTVEYPSRIVKEEPLLNWIFETLKEQTENNPGLEENQKRDGKKNGDADDFAEFVSDLIPVDFEQYHTSL